MDVDEALKASAQEACEDYPSCGGVRGCSQCGRILSVLHQHVDTRERGLDLADSIAEATSPLHLGEAIAAYRRWRGWPEEVAVATEESE